MASGKRCLNSVLGTRADDEFRTRQIERQEGIEVFLDRYSPDIDENRSREFELDCSVGPEQLGVDAARPHAEIGESTLLKLRHQ